VSEQQAEPLAEVDDIPWAGGARWPEPLRWHNLDHPTRKPEPGEDR
jgi:hypothetical protein